MIQFGKVWAYATGRVQRVLESQDSTATTQDLDEFSEFNFVERWLALWIMMLMAISKLGVPILMILCILLIGASMVKAIMSIKLM